MRCDALRCDAMLRCDALRCDAALRCAALRCDAMRCERRDEPGRHPTLPPSVPLGDSVRACERARARVCTCTHEYGCERALRRRLSGADRAVREARGGTRRHEEARGGTRRQRSRGYKIAKASRRQKAHKVGQGARREPGYQHRPRHPAHRTTTNQDTASGTMKKSTQHTKKHNKAGGTSEQDKQDKAHTHTAHDPPATKSARKRVPSSLGFGGATVAPPRHRRASARCRMALDRRLARTRTAPTTMLPTTPTATLRAAAPSTPLSASPYARCAERACDIQSVHATATPATRARAHSSFPPPPPPRGLAPRTMSIRYVAAARLTRCAAEPQMPVLWSGAPSH